MDNQSEVRKNFGPRAPDYRFSSTHGNPVDLERMISLINPASDASALDVATGGGHTAIALAGCVKSVVAIDITPEMLRQAEEAAKERGLSNIQYRIEDVHDLHFADSQFDLVASRFATHHFSGIETALSEMCRVLKPGGKFYLLDCSVVDGDEPEREINRIELLRDSSHQFSRSARLWQQLLACLPLTVRRMMLYKEQYRLPEWFDRMGTDQNKRSEIFRILSNLSADCKSHYSFGEDYLTTYRIEILADKTISPHG